MEKSTLNTRLISFSIMLVWCLSIPVHAMDSDKEGARLYIYQGCVYCHGTEGRNPTNKEAPVLAGRPANKLFDTAVMILSGEDVNSLGSKIMHRAFSDCDEPPTREELRQITGWLSAL